MSDIAEFIAARLDEDEQIAETAGTGRQARWAYEPYTRTSERGAKYANGEVYMPDTEREVRSSHGRPPSYEVNLVTCDDEGQSPAVDPEQGHHIARHDPARALLEVKAWRHVVKCLAELEEDIIAEFGSILEPFRDERTLSNLGPIAAIWNTHPDYQAEWAP